MVKEITNPHLSPSRAVAPARERAKRRQGRMWAALLSNEIHVVRSAEVVTMAEGKTARTAMVRSGRAPRCRRTQARMYVQSWDLGGLPATTMRCNVVAKVKADAKRRMGRRGGIELRHSTDEAGEQDVGCHEAERVEGRPGRNGSVWQTKRGPDTEPGDALGADALQRAARGNETAHHCSPVRGDVNTGARSRMRQRACPDLRGGRWVTGGLPRPRIGGLRGWAKKVA